MSVTKGQPRTGEQDRHFENKIEEALKEILVEARIMNMHLEIITKANFERDEVE